MGKYGIPDYLDLMNFIQDFEKSFFFIKENSIPDSWIITAKPDKKNKQNF